MKQVWSTNEEQKIYVIYRWREVSTSELLSRKGETELFLIALNSEGLLSELSLRERSWGVGGGNIISDWKDKLLPAGFSENSLTSSSLFSLTLWSCLNLSWRRAMEEPLSIIVVVGSSVLCLPIGLEVENERFNLSNVDGLRARATSAYIGEKESI